MSESDYLNAWLAYWLGAVVLSVVWWRITRKWPQWLKYPTLLAVSAGLLVPFNVEPGSTLMAPAWLVMLYEGVFVPSSGFARAAPALVICMLVAAAFYPLFVALKRLIVKGKPQDNPQIKPKGKPNKRENARVEPQLSEVDVAG